jgi:hypothetical protein
MGRSCAIATNDQAYYSTACQLKKHCFLHCSRYSLIEWSTLGVGSWYRIHNTPFSLQLTNRPNKLDCLITQLKMLTSDKHSNLLGQFPSYEENEVL